MALNHIPFINRPIAQFPYTENFVESFPPLPLCPFLDPLLSRHQHRSPQALPLSLTSILHVAVPLIPGNHSLLPQGESPVLHSWPLRSPPYCSAQNPGWPRVLEALPSDQEGDTNLRSNRQHRLALLTSHAAHIFPLWRTAPLPGQSTHLLPRSPRQLPVSPFASSLSTSHPSKLGTTGDAVHV